MSELKRESLIEIWRGTRVIGASYPVIVVTGDTIHKDIPLGEFYVFQELLKGDPISGRIVGDIAEHLKDAVTFDDFQEEFSAKALLDTSLRIAKNTFENAIYESNKELHRNCFPLDYEAVDERVFAQFHFQKRFESERTFMFAHSRSAKIRKLEETIANLPKVHYRLQPVRNRN